MQKGKGTKRWPYLSLLFKWVALLTPLDKSPFVNIFGGLSCSLWKSLLEKIWPFIYLGAKWRQQVRHGNLRRGCLTRAGIQSRARPSRANPPLASRPSGHTRGRAEKKIGGGVLAWGRGGWGNRTEKELQHQGGDEEPPKKTWRH